MIAEAPQPSRLPPAAPAALEAFEAEARRWCDDRGIDPDGSAPGIMIGPLGFALEKYWVRRARHISIAAADRPRPPSLRPQPAEDLEEALLGAVGQDVAIHPHRIAEEGRRQAAVGDDDGEQGLAGL
jgi:hypothetical protein